MLVRTDTLLEDDQGSVRAMEVSLDGDDAAEVVSLPSELRVLCLPSCCADGFCATWYAVDSGRSVHCWEGSSDFPSANLVHPNTVAVTEILRRYLAE